MSHKVSCFLIVRAEKTRSGAIKGEGRCLVCRLGLVAEAWFSFDQQALDALLHDYRSDDE